MAINYGKVVDTVQCPKKHKVYFVCVDDNYIFSLIESDTIFDITDVILRCQDYTYIEYRLKQKISE